jgi:hypothetical protein
VTQLFEDILSKIFLEQDEEDAIAVGSVSLVDGGPDEVAVSAQPPSRGE